MAAGLFRSLPKVDELLGAAAETPRLASVPRSVLRDAARSVVEELRERMRAGLDPDEARSALEPAALLEAIERVASRARAHSLARVVNATGVVLHTGLGRAPLAAAAVDAAVDAAQSCALEIERRSGERGHRDAVVGALLRDLLGCEAGTAVNNNAAATLLAVNTFARGREVVVSRGELVEIGGSYRMPLVIERGGAKLVEVGTTNRTRIADYRAAISDKTGLVMKVHTSNYRIGGFTEEAPLADLVALGRERGIAVVHDLGSGLLRRGLAPALGDEPTVEDSLACAPDLTLFSGDKLLGGPQAGVIVGKAAAVEAVRKNAMFRAMRLDKLILAALEATLRLHLEGEAERSIPAIARLNAKPADLRRRAEDLRAAILGFETALVESTSEAGSGSAPTVALPTWCVALRHPQLTAAELARALRLATPAVFARVKDDRVLLDPRTLSSDDDERILRALRSIAASDPASGSSR